MSTPDPRPAPASPAAPGEDEIQAWLVSRLSEELGIGAAEIDRRAPFNQYGLDSVGAVSLVAELEDWLGRELSPTLPYDYTNVESLARHLSTPTGGAA
jgi:acyl carrier protein